MQNKYSPALVCGFGAAVLSTVPGLKGFSCCLIIPFAAYFSLYFDQRLNGPHQINSAKGAFFGMMTGLFAASFGTILEVLMTFFLKSNDFIYALPEVEKSLNDLKMPGVFDETITMFKRIASEIQTTGFSGSFAVFSLIGNLLTDTAFGLVGGLVSASYINKRNSEQSEEE